MGNIKNYNHNRLKFKLNHNSYYDFYLNDDIILGSELAAIEDFNYNDWAFYDWGVDDGYLLSSFDFTTYTALTNTIISDYNWLGTTTSSFSATTYGLTGLDNGTIFYDKTLDDDAHTSLLSALTGTTLVHTSGDTFLTLNMVTGATGVYSYPIELITTTATTENYINLQGGFFQGYYKLDGYDYEVLPNHYLDGWGIGTWIKKNDSVTASTDTILNDIYPNNKGFFFYMGARSENKFWNVFSGNTVSDCTTGATDFCMDVKEIDIDINNIKVDGVGTDISVPLSPPAVDINLVTNKFLIFGRSNGRLCGNELSRDGFGQQRAHDYDPTKLFYSTITRREQTDFRNPFLIFGRSNGMLCGNEPSTDGFGQQRAHDYSGSTSPVIELDKDEDIKDNAIGFRIKDDGSIGYRLLTVSADCKSLEVVEEYSKPGLISEDQWTFIIVKWVNNNNNYDECDLELKGPRKGRLKFYINSFLVFTSQELSEYVGKRLNELSEKQIGVPYNISIGGGSQGLLESMTFDGQDPQDLGLVIEQNFAGTFIGSMSMFNIYNKSMSFCEIKNAYKSKKSNFGHL